MKISRNKSIKSSHDVSNIAIGNDSIEVSDDSELCDELGLAPNKKELAKKDIRSAIDNLSEIAREDEIAKDAIANLSVVLLDLQ